MTISNTSNTVQILNQCSLVTLGPLLIFNPKKNKQLSSILSTIHQETFLQGLTQWALVTLELTLIYNLNKGKHFCDIYKHINTTKWKTVGDVFTKRTPTKGTICFGVDKSIKLPKGTVFCDAYKSITNNPQKTVNIEELT